MGAEQVNAESWEACASMMAASLVSHILSDPGYFRSWPHYRGMHFLSVYWVMIKRRGNRPNMPSVKESVNLPSEKANKFRSESLFS